MTHKNLVIAEQSEAYMAQASNIVVEYEPNIKAYKLKSIRPLPLVGQIRKQILKPKSESMTINKLAGYFHYFAKTKDIQKILQNQVILYFKKNNVSTTLHEFNICELSTT